MINDEDISIVVQGPILKESGYKITSELTKFICERLKELLPKSELILSTWQGEDITGINYDKVVLSLDPGGTWFNYNDFDHLNNCNRLIVSTLAGLKLATRKYVLKVRSDLFLVSKNFLNYFYRFPLYNEEYKFVNNRIIAFSLNTLHGHKTSMFTMERPFHISDWAYFGYKNDLINLYDIPLVEEPEFSQWFLKRCKPFYDIEPWRLWKMPPEQYITYSFLKKHIPIHLEHTVDTSNNNVKMSSVLLTNNFLILDQTQFSLISLKYLYFTFSSWRGYEEYISHSHWLENYSSYMKITISTKIKYQITIVFRKMSYHALNKTLRMLNGESNYICRLIGYLIKKKTVIIPSKVHTYDFE